MNKKNMLSKAEMKSILGGQEEFGTKCSVACDPNKYACCNGGGTGEGSVKPTCLCKPDGEVNTCASGGPGSSSCSVG